MKILNWPGSAKTAAKEKAKAKEKNTNAKEKTQHITKMEVTLKKKNHKH